MLDAGKPLPFPQFGAHEHRYDVLSDPDARKSLATEGAAVLLFTAPGDGGNIFMDGPGGGGFQNKDTPDQIHDCESQCLILRSHCSNCE